MYDVKPNLVIGFHGCDLDVRDKLLNQPDEIVISRKPYDWLGHGMYFWESNYTRAFQWALDKKKRGAIKTPAVIGAILHLGYCCDLLDSKYIPFLQWAYRLMKDRGASKGVQLPKNKDLPQDKYKDKLLRELDCLVIEFMHQLFLKNRQAEIETKGSSGYKLFDSTRGAFTEGGPAFEGAGIFEKSHIQICIRNPNCIKGFFLPRQEIDFQKWLESSKPAA